MADYRILKPFILAWEGGFANDPDDTGGATNMGVTIGTYKAYCKKKGYPVPTVERLKNLDDKTWTEIYKSMFWDKCLGDRIENQNLANLIVDFYWHSGSNAAEQLQKVLGVKADGVIGNVTLSAVNSAYARTLFDKFKAQRIAWLKGRKNAWKYIKGWTNRVNGIEWGMLSVKDSDGGKEVLWKG